jgi:hypothetical protein
MKLQEEATISRTGSEIRSLLRLDAVAFDTLISHMSHVAGDHFKSS